MKTVKQIFEASDPDEVNQFLVQCAEKDWEVNDIKVVTIMIGDEEDEDDVQDSLWYVVTFTCPLDAVKSSK